jgi:hypothetical protein
VCGQHFFLHGRNAKIEHNADRTIKQQMENNLSQFFNYLFKQGIGCDRIREPANECVDRWQALTTTTGRNLCHGYQQA